jgi:hypothetical protein
VTNYPASLDTFTNPTPQDQTSSSSVKHSDQHANLNDAVAALEAKVGADSSAVTSSLDYKVNNAGGVVASKLPLAGGTMTGFIVLHADPDAAFKAATKQYVDAAAAARGYALILFGNPLGFSPADATTYYAGLVSAEASTTYAHVKLKIPKAGTVKRWDLKVRPRTVTGTGETVSHYLRLNDATDFGQIDTTYDAANKEAAATGLSQAVAAGDDIALKIVAPTWATNPTGVQILAVVYIEG